MKRRTLAAACAALVLAGGIFVLSTGTSQAAAVSGAPVVGIGGKCVDVDGDDVGGNGKAVQLWDCQTYAADQHWTQSGDGTLRTLGRCLSVNGTKAELADCAGQVWQFRGDGSLYNPSSGRCLDAPSSQSANGTRLQIWECNSTGAQKFAISPPDYTTAEAGNPFVGGLYADPDVAVYDGVYWVYPTASKGYFDQTYLDAFSSTDLVHWTKHPNVLTTANVSWAKYAVWAPAPIRRNGKYYLYFGANDIQNDSSVGGIGVAVADRPEGPYQDAIGKPLIGQFHNGAQPIDQDVFIDTDGQAYMYYGGWGHANVVKLNSDMTSVSGDFKEITPAGYTEGPQMFKRGGKYYLMWSENAWTCPDYSVSYAMADSPTGPFVKLDKVLAQDPEVARGAGHNSVINVPGTDTWYIVYHRRPLSQTDGNYRQLAYDRMYFNADGTIKRVVMEVKDNFADGDSLSWQTYGGAWSVAGGQYQTDGGKALLDDNFGNFAYDADVTLRSGAGDAGVLFRTTSPATGTDAYRGYYAGVAANGRLILGKADNNWTQLASIAVPLSLGTQYHLRVEAIGSSIKVYLGDTTTPRITVTDTSYASGATGVRSFNAAASFDNVALTRR